MKYVIAAVEGFIFGFLGGLLATEIIDRNKYSW